MITRVRMSYSVSRAGKDARARIRQAIKQSVDSGTMHRMDGDDEFLFHSNDLEPFAA